MSVVSVSSEVEITFAETREQSRVVLEIPEDIQNDLRTHKHKKPSPQRTDSSLTRAAPNSNWAAYDNSLLHRAVSDAGRWAYGAVLVELWALSDDLTCLFRPESAWWVDPVYHGNCSVGCQLCRLVDKSRRDFMSPNPLAPGEGLPCVLWTGATSEWMNRSQLSTGGGGGHHRRSSSRNRAWLDAAGDLIVETPRRHVTWRHVRTIADDPDQPWNPRLQLLGQLGLGWAAAVPFSMHGQQGIVVYMAREGVDLEHLQSPTNERYLMAAADLAGAAYALRSPRQVAVRERSMERVMAWRRFRARVVLLVRQGRNLADVVAEYHLDRIEEEFSTSHVSEHSRVQSFVEELYRAVLACLRKSRGGGSIPPPPFTTRQTLITFVGVLTTFALLTRTNAHLGGQFGKDFELILGPLGALMTLQYGLTAAPASQPRNALLGQLVSITIAMTIGYIEALPLWIRQSLATSAAVAAMVRMGITHPPAGAAAAIFSSGRWTWYNALVMLLANGVAIAMATFVNNCSRKRQYPMYWGLQFVEDWAQSLHSSVVQKKRR